MKILNILLNNQLTQIKSDKKDFDCDFEYLTDMSLVAFQDQKQLM